MKKRAREPKPLIPALASATGTALIKHLASSNTTVRSQSFRLLQSWLVSQTQQLSESDVKKLWKGLFYCLWHADKTPYQVALIDRLTSLFISLQPSLSLEFFRGFLVTLRREWPGIDRLRLDKFYLLIRRFTRALFELMRLRKWKVGVLGVYFGVMESEGFLAEDKLQGNGVNYHVASVFLEELKGVGFPVRKEVVDVILGPFFRVMMSGKDRVMLLKVKSCVFDELARLGKEVLAKRKMGVDFEENDGDLLLGLVGLKMGLSEKLYEVGSSDECVQGNRKVVLGLHEEFLKLEKELLLSGIEIDLPKYNDDDDEDDDDDDDDDDVAQLIPSDVEKKAPERAVKKTTKKKTKKVNKDVAGDDKKKNKRQKKRNGDIDNEVSEKINPAVEVNNELVAPNGNKNPRLDYVTELDLNKNVILNLQKQFEKVAASMDSKRDEASDFFDNSVNRIKRKRSKSVNGDGVADATVQRAKKVRFSLKSNLVWKPPTPLPPERLRFPPSTTPRGSALKKGVPPGPVIEMLSKNERRKLSRTKKRALLR